MTDTRNHQHQQQPPKRRLDEYPSAIRAEGKLGMRVFDRLERELLRDGFTLDEASMLMVINLEDVLGEIAAVKAKTHPA